MKTVAILIESVAIVLLIIIAIEMLLDYIYDLKKAKSAAEIEMTKILSNNTLEPQTVNYLRRFIYEIKKSELKFKKHTR